MVAEDKTTGLQAKHSVLRNHKPDPGSDPHSQARPARVGGLCSTCIHAAGCALNTFPQEPVLFCEEFDSRLSSAGESPAGSQKPVRSDKHDADTVKQAERWAGLCINCLHRDNCRLSRSDGGVWYCEEYE